MPMYDPNKATEGDRKYATPGWKVLHSTGWWRWAAKSGTPMVTVGFVVLEDRAEGQIPDPAGAVVRENFAFTENALFRFGRLCLALRWNEPFDTDSDEDIEKILGRSPVMGLVQEEEYDGKKRASIDKFAAFEGRIEPGWDDVIQEGEKDHNEFIEWLQERQREAARNPNRQASRPAAQRTSPAAGGGHSASGDIPF